MAPAAGDSSQRPAAGPPRLGSSPGRGHAPPGLYEVDDMHQTNTNTYTATNNLHVHPRKITLLPNSFLLIF